MSLKVGSKRTQNASPFDITCPICVEVFIEPITLPCDHTLCKPCFQLVLEKSTVVCPLCRRRLHTWARQAQCKGTLVDTNKWDRIKRNHGDMVKARLANKTPQKPTNQAPILLSKTGEIRKEYEAELARLEEERRKQREEEERASKALIDKIIEEEKIAFTQPQPVTRTKRPLQPHNSQDLSRCDSIDSITAEYSHHFKPIVRYPRTPPRPSEKHHRDVICPKSVKRIEFSSPSSSSASTEILASPSSNSVLLTPSTGSRRRRRGLSPTTSEVSSTSSPTSKRMKTRSTNSTATRNSTPSVRCNGTPNVRRDGTPNVRRDGTPSVRRDGTPSVRRSAEQSTSGKSDIVDSTSHQASTSYPDRSAYKYRLRAESGTDVETAQTKPKPSATCMDRDELMARKLQAEFDNANKYKSMRSEENPFNLRSRAKSKNTT